LHSDSTLELEERDQLNIIQNGIFLRKTLFSGKKGFNFASSNFKDQPEGNALSQPSFFRM
jgi:hypothetical protein